MTATRSSQPAIFLAASVILGIAGPAEAGVTMYLEVEGVKGGSTATEGKDMIEVASMSHQVAMPLTSGASGARASGRPNHADFTVKMPLGVEFPTLSLKVSEGANLRSVKLHVWSDSGTTGARKKILQYTFENVVLTSVAVEGANGALPTASVSFTYAGVGWQYWPAGQGASGPGARGAAEVSTGWNVEQNKAR